jgi:hypothetical protein
LVGLAAYVATYEGPLQLRGLLRSAVSCSERF